LLKQVAHRMTHCVRNSDTVARIGGDEFVVLLPALDSGEAAMFVAEKIRKVLNEPFDLDGVVAQISASIGVSLYPDHGQTELELAKMADLAMYSVKSLGRNGVRIAQIPSS
jgi:diguanylate cyclase (GGDEF)-like protein